METEEYKPGKLCGGIKLGGNINFLWQIIIKLGKRQRRTRLALAKRYRYTFQVYPYH